jgi:MraZ protein
MFLGEYSHALDDKGRLTLPARWREELGESVVITRGLDQCLFVFPADTFEAIAREIDQLGFSKSDARALSRYLSAKAIDDQPDRQGRIIVPASLREFAAINGEALIVGAFSRIEIWNAQRYAEANRVIEENAEQISERLGDVLQRVMNRKEDS